MGNHEYCEDCGENDFHLGRPCNPEKVKAKEAEAKKLKQEKEKRYAVIKEKLDKAELSFYYDGTCFKIY